MNNPYAVFFVKETAKQVKTSFFYKFTSASTMNNPYAVFL